MSNKRREIIIVCWVFIIWDAISMVSKNFGFLQELQFIQIVAEVGQSLLQPLPLLRVLADLMGFRA